MPYAYSAFALMLIMNDMAAINNTWLGIDIGGTKCAVVLGRTTHGKEEYLSREPEIVDRREFATADAGGPEEAINKFIKIAQEMIADTNRGEKPAAAGISCGSPLNSRTGNILSPPNLPGWDNIPVAKTISDALDVPAYLLNDADAGALAEWQFGSGRGYRNMAFITFGTGFGAGLILNEQLYSGTDDGAGEIGHIRIRSTGPVGYGKAGSLEGFCSGGGIAQLARIKALEKLQMGQKVSFLGRDGDLSNITARTIGEAADAGDELAREILAISGDHLGRGLAILLDLLNLECIVIGSIFCRSYNWIWPAAERSMAAEALERNYKRCRIKTAGLGERIGDIAALSVAIEGFRGRLQNEI